jgi:hypothetical protein
MRKHLVIAATAATIGITGLGAGIAHAATSSENTTKTDSMSKLVEAVASKFNLNKTEVQQVFDDQKVAIQAEHEQNIKEQVAKLVTDGKINQAQADALNAKRAELQKEREANKDTFQSLTEDERKTERNQHKTDLEAWAKENNIDTKYLRFVMGGHGHGPGRHHTNME